MLRVQQSFRFGALIGMLLAGIAEADSWSQFRGPNGSGKAVGAQPLPADIGPNSHVLWKTPLPGGHSSPVVVADRIYLTGVRDGEEQELVTFCLDCATGEVLWESPAKYTALEPINPTFGSYAQSTCTANEDRVVSFFGSAGMFCYDRSGNLLWHKSFPPFKNDDGTGSSPILVGDRIILSQDHDVDSFLAAIRLSDGSTIWKTDRPQFIRGYATPVMWNNHGERQIVIAGSLMVKGYDLETGREAWSVRGLSWGVVATPVVGDDGVLYVSSLASGIVEVSGRAPSFAEVDSDANGVLDQQEFERSDALLGFFTHFDRNKDDEVIRSEYESLRTFWEASRHVLLAIRPGGTGDISDTHVIWSTSRAVPSVPSPVFHDGSLFVVKDGGLMHCLDAKTGEADRPRRISGRGDYYSSPVVGDGKIYLISRQGDLSVITARRKWREVASAQFDEEAYATPAIVEGRIYLRTASHLYCFGYDDPDSEAHQDTPYWTRWPRVAAIGLGIFGGVVLAWRFSRGLRRRARTA